MTIRWSYGSNIPFYYINTNEIPGKLNLARKHDIFTRENNMLFSHVKRSSLL